MVCGMGVEETVAVCWTQAEGFKRRGIEAKRHFYNIAQGSLEELSYYVLLSRDPGYVNGGESLECRIERTGRMLNAFMKTASP